MATMAPTAPRGQGGRFAKGPAVRMGGTIEPLADEPIAEAVQPVLEAVVPVGDAVAADSPELPAAELAAAPLPEIPILVPEPVEAVPEGVVPVVAPSPAPPVSYDPVPAGTEKVYRFWTAGPGSPQTAILKTTPAMRAGEPVYQLDPRTGRSEQMYFRTKFKPGRDGSLVVYTEEDAAYVRKHMGNDLYEEDLPPGVADLKCTHCNWTCRSMRAFEYHLNNLHPGPRQNARV
jgi:hypothetical protein